MAVDIEIPADVRAALGPDGVRAIEALSTLAGGRCPACQTALPAEGPAVVVLVHSSTTAHAAYVHPPCAALLPGHVIAAPDDTLAAAWPDEIDMGISVVLLDQAGAVMPVLIAQLTRSRMFLASRQTGPLGDLTDVVVSTLLQQGFGLVTRLREAPRRTAPGWRAVLGPLDAEGGGQLDVIDADGSLFYTGTCYPPSSWVDAIARLGWCIFYSGALDYDQEDPAATVRALRSAAASGGLVGARVPVVLPSTAADVDS
jgi:hypothetical protein